jgi:N-acetylglucosamine-6-phosphate deacetylase
MRPVHHRDPGPIVALLGAAEVVCEQIADGVHLHDGMLRHVVQAAGAARVALVTDAMAASGMADGEYDLGGQEVRVDGGVARLAASGTIAGSTLTMDAGLRRAVHSGVSLADAVRMASTTPATVLGLDDRGSIAVGLRADLVLLDDALNVTGVIRDGVRHDV